MMNMLVTGIVCILVGLGLGAAAMKEFNESKVLAITSVIFQIVLTGIGIVAIVKAILMM